ncbi:hypothetical protein OIU78_027935 [Salix suchowensis]|nr:hypothetical protein OIU78_027935 [Salix suchowensis]
MLTFLSDSDSDSEDVATENNDREKKEWAIPPPYNPFNKQQPVVFEDPEDPKDLQHIFHRMRSEGDKGQMPDVVAYTAVMEAYFNAGLAVDAKLVDAKKYVLEMMAKGMRPNAHTYAAVFEAFTKENKVEEAKVLLQQMKDKGFVPDEKAVRHALSNKRGQVFRTVIGILFDKI